VNILERLEFDYDYNIVDEIKTLLMDIDDSYPLIAVYGKYDVIREILEDLIAEGFSIANEIELEDYDVSYYDKEFVLYVSENGINVEKTFIDDKYYYGGGNISFVHEDCSSALLKYIESDRVYEFGYSDESDSSSEESEKEHEYMVNGKPVSIEEYNDFVSRFAPDKVIETSEKPSTISKVTYQINGRNATKEEYETALSDIANTYLDNMKDMLLRYEEMIDEMNEWQKLLGW